MLVPPNNFGLVEPGIYRCSKLESDNFPFLETLKLKSLIVLDAEKPPRLLNNFLESNNIELFNLGGLKISNHHHTGTHSNSSKDDDDEDNNDNDESISGSNIGTSEGDIRNEDTLEIININNQKKKTDQWMLIDRNIISGAFELLFNKTKHNILLVDSTSTVVGILRKIQKWNFNSIVNEYRIYSGSSSKNNYYAENFLELIQVELIPYEIDQLNHQLKQQQSEENKQKQYNPENQFFRSPEFAKTNLRSLRNNSIYDDLQWEEDDAHSIDDDDMDDELLSASPQIPANLLKLVEQRKQEKSRDQSDNSDNDITPGTSPIIGKSSRNNSFTNEMILSTTRVSIERRRSSIDSKFIRINNNKFRNQNSPSNQPRRASYESKSPIFRKIKEKESRDLNNLSTSDIERIKEKYDFKYYKNLNKYPVNFENVSILKLKLPLDNKLPDWFVRGRNYWEDNFKKLNNY